MNGSLWLPDPSNPEREEDGFGAYNSVLEVGPEARKAALGDFRVVSTALAHNPTQVLHRRREAKGLTLGITTARDDVDQVWVEGPTGVRIPLDPRPLPRHKTLWTGAAKADLAAYRFVLADGPQVDGFGAEGWMPRPDQAEFFEVGSASRLQPPRWVEDTVFYQIFPDRFFNGDSGNDPDGVEAWGSEPKIEGFQGGDLKGIQQKLGALRDLGVTGLYLNPVFSAPSNHKYDTRDFLAIDPSFGTTQSLRDLVHAAHAQDTRVILDGVFNHTGDEFAPFLELKRDGRRSQYADWYHFEGGAPAVSPEGVPNYEAWWGFQHLPEWRTELPAVRDYVRDVVRFWRREVQIDGWRLDVPNEVPHEFWREFRRWVREADPEAYTVGEIWQDGQAWMQGNEFDGVMNYRLRDLMLGFWARQDRTGAETLQAVAELENSHPPAAYRAMLNLMGSHDTPRLATLTGGDHSLALGAYSFLFTSPGAPSIYYGDEVGLKGEKDPGCRRAYPWESPPAPGLREKFIRLAELRRQRKPWRRGRLQPLSGYPDDWMVYQRGPWVLALRRGGPETAEVPGVPSNLPAGTVFDAASGRLGPLPIGQLAVLFVE